MMRKRELEKLRVNSEFMKDWWTHGLEEHSKNLNIRKENELHDLRNKMFNEEKKRNMEEMRVKESVDDVYRNIEQFERDIVMSQFRVDSESTKNASLDSIKERTARMRKALNDEINTVYHIEDSRREDEYIDFLTKRSKDEHTQGYEEWKIIQCKNILIEGRKLTAARYQSRREMDLKASYLKESELLEDERK